MTALHKIMLWQKAERNDARKLNLSTPAYHLLCIVAIDMGHKLSDYAKLMKITAVSVTQLSDQLEVRGYAKRTRKSTDRRAWSLNLTAEGAKAIDRITLNTKN
jgi:DNA-binding MarR family transcriptional regulator